MSQPKGKLPAHIKSKSFDHPSKTSHIVSILCEKEDSPESSSNFRHSLATIIFVPLNTPDCVSVK